MKIAICLFGNVGGKIGSFEMGGSLNPKFSIDNYMSHLVQEHDVDFHVHSWSEEYEELINKLCKPKAALFVKQIDFTNYEKEKYIYDHYQKNIDELVKFADYTFSDAENHVHVNTCAAHSRLYSVKKVVEIMSLYADEHNIEYDFVMQLRFDLIFSRKVDFHKLKKDVVYYPKRYSKDDHIAAEDLYMIASMANTQKFSKLYDFRYDFSSRVPVATLQYLKHLGIPRDHYGEILYSFCLIRNEIKALHKNLFTRFTRKVYKLLRGQATFKREELIE